MNKKRFSADSFGKRVLSLFLCVTLMTALPIVSSGTGGSWVASSGATFDGGVWTSDTSRVEIEYKDGDLSLVNTVSADFCYTGDATTGDREYVGIEIYSKKGNYYRFAIWPNTASSGPAVLFVQKDTEDPISRFIRLEMDAATCGKGVWYNMEATLDDNRLSLSINGKEICNADTLGISIGEFEWEKVMIVSKGCPAQMKNLKINSVSGGTSDDKKGWIPNLNITESDGIYTSNKESASLIYRGDMKDLNTVSADFCYTGDATTGDMEYVGIEVHSKDNSYYRFAVWPNTAGGGPAVLLIQKDSDNPANRYDRMELDSALFGKEKWYNMSVTIQDGYFALYLGGNRIATADSLGIDVGTFEWDSVRIVSRGCPAKMRSPKLSYTEPDYSGHTDFTFGDESAVLAFTSQGATLGWADDRMTISLSESGASVTSPEIVVNPGHRYSVKLGVRNTFVVRMKNGSDASKIRLYYKVRGDAEFSVEHSKEFDIAKNSDMQTYYFNLSDVVDCDCIYDNTKLKNCNHYLSQFKLEFVGAESGDVEIEDISFSRESRLYDYAAESISAIANGATDKVIVSGKLAEKYSGMTVTVLETSVKNFNQLIDFKGNKILGSAKANGRDFSVEFPFIVGNMNHLSTRFIAVVSDGDDYINGVKLSDVFMIDNWRDFSENPYSFTLPNGSVDVTDYGAKGDGFTDDTAAIQRAIDDAISHGIGKVVIPGDTSTSYGRRYIMTGIEITGEIELYIEEGAILWQSHDESHYTKYKVYHGHTDMGKDVAWGLSSLMHNPFIYIHDASNVRITGGGMLRMDDTGTEWLDGNGYAWDAKITVGCSAVIHLVPIVIYGCKNVEVSDIDIRRASCWHAYIRESSNIYFGNVDLDEVNCINGDGFDFSTAVHDVVVDRCCLYSNDDALVLAVTTNDPRDDLSIWRSKSTTDDKSVYNFKIRNCNLYGGHGLTFIPWASDFEDQSKVEIYNIDVENCVLGGTTTSVGVWADNPFYGKSNYWDGTYGSTDAVEDGDYSPIHDLRIVNNKYTDNCSFYGVDIPSVVTDMKIKGTSELMNGNFDKDVHKGKGYDDETNFKNGLSYWTKKGDVGVSNIGKKDTTIVGTKQTVTIDNYAGCIKKEGELSQGLYLSRGTYELKISTRAAKDGGLLFVRGEDGTVMAKLVVEASDAFVERVVSFSVDEKMNITVGVANDCDAELYIDDVSVNKVSNTPEKPNTPDTPDTPDTPETSDVPDTPDTPDNPDEPETPDTPQMRIPYIIIGTLIAAAAAVVGIVLIKKKRKAR